MTQKDKELLLKDLCARLPYGVKLQKTYDTSDPVELYLIDLCHHTIKFYTYKGEGLTMCDVGNIERFGKLRYKPYLFPLSSMTDEQLPYYITTLKYNEETRGMVETSDSFDWLNKNHYDYRGLIPKGLALDATGLDIY